MAKGPEEECGEEAGQGEVGRRPIGSRGPLKASSEKQPLQRALQHGY